MKQSKALFFSIIAGVVAYPIFSYAAPLIPWMLFGMLFVTYTKLDLRTLRVESIHLKLLLIQAISVAFCIFVYFVFMLYAPMDSAKGVTHISLQQIGVILSQGALICFLAPTALSAAVITATMGGSLSRLLTYTFITNISIAVVAPLIFTIVGTHAMSFDQSQFAPHVAQLAAEPASHNFTHTFAVLLWKVVPMLLLPFFAALLCRWFVPSVFRFVEKRQSISFYLWVIGVTLIMARTTKSIVDHGWIHWKTELALAFIALFVAAIQFKVGRALGRKYGDPISAGQALGQKNTILAIWMAQSFLHPLAALAPASYVLWQNLINSYQLHRAHSRPK